MWRIGAVLGVVMAVSAAGWGKGYRVEYCTYFGGSQDEQLREIIPLADGVVMICGQTNSDDIPVTKGAVQEKYGGEPAGSGHPGLVGGDCVIAKLDIKRARIEAATYFGGAKQERNVYGMDMDRDGNVVITTTTRSEDMPTTPNAYQRKYGGGSADWVAAKLSGDLKRLIWCTYVGGSDGESPRGGLALDKEGNVYLVGTTQSRNFPTSTGALRRKLNGSADAAVVKLRADGSGLVFSTLLGGSGDDGILGAVVDDEGRVHIAGHTTSPDFPVSEGAPQVRPGGKSDVFLATLSSDGSRLLASTLLGGSGQEFAEHRPLLLADGSMLLSGVSGSADFPTTARAVQQKLRGANDAFLARLAADGRSFAFVTLLGGSGNDFALMPHVDKAGNIYIVGQTSSRDFPVTADALQKTYGGGSNDGFLAVFSGDGSRLVYATYIGGEGDDIVRGMALGERGEVYLTGNSASRSLPVTDHAVQKTLRGNGTADGFVMVLVPQE